MRTRRDFRHNTAKRFVLLYLPMNDIGQNLPWPRRGTADDRRGGFIAARLDPKDGKFSWRSRHGIGSMLIGVIRLRVGA